MGVSPGLRARALGEKKFLSLNDRWALSIIMITCSCVESGTYLQRGFFSMATIPITKRGAEKLKEELHRLKTVDRPSVINAIAAARAQGDLSENAEYDAAKDRQGFIEGRIQEIESKLSMSQVIDPSALDADGKVVFGSTVVLQDQASSEEVTYQIVGEDEADLKLGLINVSSPIARALIGKEDGDMAVVQAPGGEKRYEIVSVSYR